MSGSFHEEPGYLSCMALGYGMDDPNFDSRKGLGIIFFTTASRTALGLTQPPTQCVPVIPSLGIKRLGREADYSSPSIVEVKNAWSCTSIPPIRFHGVVFS
jgi:hypothetical protein